MSDPREDTPDGAETAQVPGSSPWWGEPWSADEPPAGAAPMAGAQPTGPWPPPRRRRLLGGLAIAVAIVAFTGIGAGIGVVAADNDSSGDTKVTLNKSGQVAAAPAIDSSGTTNIESVAAAVLPTVVSIDERTSQLEGTGSGVIIDADHGYVLTNNHVVEAAATGSGKITVTMNDGRTATATVRGRDPSSDIAVIEVATDGLTQAKLGDSNAVKVGQTVVAFGSPLGLQGSVTSGIVSALDRPVSPQDSSQVSSQATIDAIQTDAAINPGNSGGPLVDGAGQVIGINSAIASAGGGTTQSGSIGVGFAIPINEAIDTAQQIIQSGHAVHPVLEASIAAVAGGDAGAVLRDVSSGGPAENAGLRVGDVVTAVDGTPTNTPNALIVALRKGHHPGDAVTLSYTRDGQQKKVTVTLGASAPSP